MEKRKIDTFEAVGETMAALSGPGALLVAGAEPANPMTVGWGQIGIAWGRPVFLVMVRRSRYTHELMEKAEAFSVNVPPESMKDCCMLCGSRSGRDTDKIAETGLTVEAGKSLVMEGRVPTLAECPLHYECRILHRNEVDPATLDGEVAGECYGDRDYHTIYWGEIVGVYRRG